MVLPGDVMSSSSGGWLDSLDQSLNQFGADTLGVVYQAATGNVDPWTQAVQEDQAYDSVIDAGGSDADAQAASDAIANTAASAPSNTETNGQLLGAQLASLFNQPSPGSDCDIFTNPSACVPSWVLWVVGGVVGLLILLVAGEYAPLFERK